MSQDYTKSSHETKPKPPVATLESLVLKDHVVGVVEMGEVGGEPIGCLFLAIVASFSLTLATHLP